MKISMFILLVVVERITSSSVAKKLVVEHKDAQRSVRQSPIETQTAYVLAQAYEPKIDAHQWLKQYESLGVAEANAYSQAFVNQESLFSPSHGYDISKLYTVKSSKTPSYVAYTPKARVQAPVAYKIEQPLSFVYTTVKPTAAALTVAAPVTIGSLTGGEEHYQHSDSYASKYKFGYRVSDPHSGTDFGHSEVSEGHITKGHYHVLLPDGRIQNVRYWAGPSGYHATVTYEGAKLQYV